MAGGNGRGPRRPPVGGGASRSTPFSPGGQGGGGANKRTLRNVGQRRPDETGMLEMVPLSHDDDEAEAAGDPSATAFFAIPAPKAERARPNPSGMGGGAPPPPSGIGAGLGTGAPPPPGVMRQAQGGGPPSAAGRPPMGQPPPAAVRGPVAAPGGMGSPPPAVGIQGPVAGYGGGAPGAAQTPFQVGGGAGAAGAPGGGQQRVKSQVVWVVLFGALMFIGAAALLAVYLVRSDNSIGDEVVADAGSRKAASVGDAKPRTKQDPSLDGAADAGSDTGIPRPKKTKKRRPARGGGSGTKAPAKASRPKAPSGPATLTVRLPGIQASSVEVVCPSARKRAAVSGEAASIPGVPQEECTLFLKGGAPGKYGPVHGGQSLSCSMSGVTLRCR